MSKEVIGFDAYNQSLTGRESMTVTSSATDFHHVPCVIYKENIETVSRIIYGGGEDNLMKETNEEHKMKSYGFDRASFNQGENARFNFFIFEEEQPTLQARGPGAVAQPFAVGNGQVDQTSLHDVVGALNCMHDQQAVMTSNGDTDDDGDYIYIVRRITPLECTRLQGFPDGWVDIGDWIDSKGRKHRDADSPKYKALGNSLAIPFFKFLAKSISAQYERDITMGGLFSGIGGFERCFAEVNGLKNVRWCSEIEEFPCAVLKKHFGDEDEGVEGDFYKYMNIQQGCNHGEENQQVRD